MAAADFMQDKRTQQAVVMSLIVLGEAATKVMDQHFAFTEQFPQIPWRSMRGMRNRIAHGYFDINLEVVWDTVQTTLTALKVSLMRCRRPDTQPTQTPPRHTPPRPARQCTAPA